MGLTFVDGFDTSTNFGGTWTSTITVPWTFPKGSSNAGANWKPYTWEKPRRKRDSQKGRVYKANHMMGRGVTFYSVAEVQMYIDQCLLATPWWKTHYPHVQKIVVQKGRCRVKATATKHNGIYTINNMPMWARCQRYILHEVAHCVIYDLYTGKVAHHGPEFAREFLNLVQRFMGDTAAIGLKGSYALHGVKVAPENYRKAFPSHFTQSSVQAMEHQHSWIPFDNWKQQCGTCKLFQLYTVKERNTA